MKIDETLLWSHYADEHRGLCLTYKIPMSFLKGKIIGAQHVNYPPEPLAEFLKTCPTEPEEFIRKLLRIYLTTKSPAWEYEKEARIIGKRHGILDIPKNFIKEICFGLRTPQPDIDLVTRLARDYCNCDNFSQMIRDETEFGLTMKKL